MSQPPGAGSTFVVASTFDSRTRTRATVRSLLTVTPGADVLVVDVDGGHEAYARERVVVLHDLARSAGAAVEATSALLTLEPDQVELWATALAAAVVVDAGGRAVVLGAGLLVLDDLEPLMSGVSSAVVLAVDTPGLARSTGAARLLRRDGPAGSVLPAPPAVPPLHSRALHVLGTSADVSALRELAADWRTAASALDVFAATGGPTRLDPGLLVSPWRSVATTGLDEGGRLVGDGRRVAAVDLTRFDVDAPWLLDAGAATAPRVLLSQHPVLAGLVAEEAALRRDDRPARRVVPPARARWDDVLRGEARRARQAGGPLPDLLGPGGDDRLEDWAVSAVPDAHPAPVARYLAALRKARPDLQQAFRVVPGPDSRALARWGREHGVHETAWDGELIALGVERTLVEQAGRVGPRGLERPAGVNLVGYLAGELGVGESARLVDDALQAVGVSTSTFDVSRDLESRRGASFRRSTPTVHSTSLVCVNGAETAELVPQLRSVLRGTRVIGMWYWELEDFPAAHQVGLQHVDEVWAATDFVRDAIARHAGDVPVRTVTPPLPQAGPDPGRLPVELGIPTDRDWFLFTFDFLSLAIRKNPVGLVDAFTRAFVDLPEAERPVLVLKTINAARHPADAEELRQLIAGRTDVLLVDAYLDHDQRHVLVSHCTAYVSLHRAEGLGLTVAEAMAWGKPVITTAYGGVMQFCTPENSLLVDWSPGRVARTVDPYVEGMAWADPDLDHAALLMRSVVDDPARAAAVARRAADDIRDLHDPVSAGRRMQQALAEGDAAWRAARLDPAPPASAPEPVAGPAGRLRSAVARRRRR